MNIIYYQTKTQFENTGDVLINNALIHELRKYGKLRCNCSQQIPDEFINELEINDEEKMYCKNDVSFSLKILKNAVKEKKKGNRIYVISGLGHQYGGNFKTNIKIIISAIIFMIFKLFGIKIIKIGSSIGPVTKGMAVAERFRSNFIDAYYVRDTKSYQLCQEIKINKAKLCPDMSWIYLNHHKSQLNDNNIVTVNLRKSILNENDEEYQKKLIETTDIALNEISKSIKNMRVFFVYQVRRDEEFARTCYEYFKNKYDCYFNERQILLSNAQTIYSESVFNISSRLHSLLLGYKYGALPIAIINKEKHIKISQTFIDCKIDDLIFDINERDIHNLDSVIQNKNERFKSLIDVEKEKCNEIRNILNEIFV